MGRKKRLQKQIKSWMDGYIDFSNLDFEGYSYIKSTYRKDFASALITPQSIDIIKNLIPLFNQKESITTRIIRMVYERKGKDTNLGSSFLLRLYCNGFTNAFKDIDKKIKKSANKLIYPSVEDCQHGIQDHINKLEDRNNCPTQESKGTQPFLDYLLDLGEQEGATIRGLLYQQERNTGTEAILPIEKSEDRQTTKTLKDIISNIIVADKDEVINRIEEYLKVKNTELDIAYLKIALEELNYIPKYAVTKFHSALEDQYSTIEFIGYRGVQKSYKNLNERIQNKFVKDTKEHIISIDELKTFLSD